MSLQMQLAKRGLSTNARAAAMGDPGLFSFVGKALSGIGSLVPGPIGSIAKIAGGALSGPKSVKTATLQQRGLISGPIFGGSVPRMPVLQAGSGVQIGGPSGVQIGTFGPGVGSSNGNFQGVTGGSSSTAPAPSGSCGIAGHHFNRTAYWTKGGNHVGRGERCVKNRKRNPLNPRALSRAMSRVKSAQKAVRCLQLFAGPAARASSKAGPRRRKGACKSCK